MKNKRFLNPPYIRYSNCYEDVNVLLKTIENKENTTILSVASGLDNTLALLTTNPQEIIAFDYNITQIYLANLKMVAYKYLDYNDLLNILGFDDNKAKRIINYQKISSYLNQDTKTYFDNNSELITKIGINNAGRFEYYLRLFNKKILPLMHTKRTIKRFLSFDNIKDQSNFYQTKFNNHAYKYFFKKFFNEKTMSKLGREKAYFTYAENDVATYLKQQIDYGFTNVLNKENPFMQYILTGKFNKLPFYLQMENYEKIKRNINKITLVYGDLNTVNSLNKTYDFLNLSDIFEYMSTEETSKAEDLINNLTNRKGKVVFWNMIVKRNFTKNYFKVLDSNLLFNKAQPFFYQSLWRYEKNDNN